MTKARLCRPRHGRDDICFLPCRLGLGLRVRPKMATKRANRGTRRPNRCGRSDRAAHRDGSHDSRGHAAQGRHCPERCQRACDPARTAGLPVSAVYLRGWPLRREPHIPNRFSPHGIHHPCERHLGPIRGQRSESLRGPPPPSKTVVHQRTVRPEGRASGATARGARLRRRSPSLPVGASAHCPERATPMSVERRFFLACRVTRRPRDCHRQRETGQSRLGEWRWCLLACTLVRATRAA